MITLHGYTVQEKLEIGVRYLAPKQILENGLDGNLVEFDPKCLQLIIESYTREAGVRNFERQIGTVCRSLAVEYADAHENGHTSSFNGRVTIQKVYDILGVIGY
jgi:ATP-dependent Lon protease